MLFNTFTGTKAWVKRSDYRTFGLSNLRTIDTEPFQEASCFHVSTDWTPVASHRSDSVDVGDEWNDELGVTDAHADASPRVRRSADVSGVVAAGARVVLDRRVLSLIAAAWDRKPGRPGLTLVDGRLDDPVRRRAGRPRLHAVIVETSELRATAQTPRRTRLAYLIPRQPRQRKQT